MEKLIEMDAAGVVLRIYSPSFSTYSKKWDIAALREADGVKLEITVQSETLGEAIDEVYAKWLVATRGLPQHSLRQLTLQPSPGHLSTQEIEEALGLNPPPPPQEPVGNPAGGWSKELNDEIPF